MTTHIARKSKPACIYIFIVSTEELRLTQMINFLSLLIRDRPNCKPLIHNNICVYLCSSVDKHTENTFHQPRLICQMSIPKANSRPG